MFKLFLNEIKNQPAPIKVIRSDNALKYMQQEFFIHLVSFVKLFVLIHQNKMVLQSARIIICLMLHDPS